MLAHGAGADCEAKVLVAVSAALCAAGFLALRIDLPFRQKRPSGPPFPAGRAADLEGLREAVAAMRSMAPGRVVLGGHSYGGRLVDHARGRGCECRGCAVADVVPAASSDKAGGASDGAFPATCGRRRYLCTGLAIRSAYRKRCRRHCN